MATVRCRSCGQQSNSSLTHCEHCGQPLRPSGLLAYLKSSKGELSSAPTGALTSKSERSDLARSESRSASDDLPHSAIIYFHAPEFFAVRVSGERSIIARLFGSSLELPSLCSAMLFTAYASLIENGFAKLQVAAVTPTSAIIFPIPAQWIKLIFEMVSLYKDPTPTIESMLMQRATSRLSSSATQQLIADLIGWQGPPTQSAAQQQTHELFQWNRHYAEALTATIRQQYPTGRVSARGAVEKTEAMLTHFCQQHRHVATYLSHEISLIMRWIASKQDPQLQQRYHLLMPNAPNILHLSPAVLYDEEYWRTIAQHAQRLSAG